MIKEQKIYVSQSNYENSSAEISFNEDTLRFEIKVTKDSYVHVICGGTLPDTVSFYNVTDCFTQVKDFLVEKTEKYLKEKNNE